MLGFTASGFSIWPIPDYGRFWGYYHKAPRVQVCFGISGIPVAVAFFCGFKGLSSGCCCFWFISVVLLFVSWF